MPVPAIVGAVITAAKVTQAVHRILVTSILVYFLFKETKKLGKQHGRENA